MKKLANLKGAKILNRIEQKSLNGGRPGIGSSRGCCNPADDCCTTWDLVGRPRCPANGYSNPNCDFAYAVGNSYTDCCI